MKTGDRVRVITSWSVMKGEEGVIVKEGTSWPGFGVQLDSLNVSLWFNVEELEPA